MKYKSRPNSLINSNNFNRTITTFNLKIKNIDILLDDITTNKASQNVKKIKRSNSLQNNNDFYQKFSTKTYNSSLYLIYNKKRLKSKKDKKDKKEKEEKDKTVKSIPISFKRNDSYQKTESPSVSFLTTMDRFYNTNLTGLISERNNLNKRLFINRVNYNDNNDISNTIDDIIEKNKIYIKKFNKGKFRYNYRRNSIKNENLHIIFRTKLFNNKGKKENLVYKSKTLNLKLNQPFINSQKKIEKKKIKFNFKRENKKETRINYYFNIKSIILIQKWWKSIKLKIITNKNAIIIQKAFRYFLKRKIFNNPSLINKIPKNNFCQISKLYYKNNIQDITLIQKYFKKYLIKIQFYNFLPFNNNLIPYHFLFQKQKIRPCYITKKNNLTSFLKGQNITFAKKKIVSISKRKRNLKYKSLINNYSSFSYNFRAKGYDLKADENSVQNINNSESHDFNNNDIINKITYEITNQNDIKNNQFKYEEKMDLYGLFIKNIFLKINSTLFQVGYKYKSLLNFINSIDWIYIKYKLDSFFEILSFLKTRKINFIRNICRHINIYKKSNYIKNEIIELIEHNLPKGINCGNFDYKTINFTLEQENNLINTQIFKEDKNLINYIYLFFKYEKNKKVNINFIENRLIKEPLNYRNIFTILRYIDNLDEKINTNKICTNCFCKKNERVCFMKCNCHFLMNLINLKSHDFNKKRIKQEFKTYHIGDEVIENNPNILNTEQRNNMNYIKSKVNKIDNNNINNNIIVIRKIRINKTFDYFNK